MSEETKICSDCGQTKPITKFRPYKSRLGRIKFCNQCHWQRYGAKNNALYKTETGRLRKSIWRRTRILTDTAREREKRHSIRYHSKYPEKLAAQRAVREAIKSGTLIRPERCERCNGLPGKRRDGAPLVQAHHADYSKPLEILWLCVMCHAAEHRSALKSAGSAEGEAGKT